MDDLIRADRDARTTAYRNEAAPGERDLRARLQRLSVRQQRFEKYLADDLAIDRAGLETMDHLISSGQATPSELARKTGLSTAAMSLVLNRLEAAGHISRDRHPSDGRKLVVTASTASADRAHAALLPMIDSVEALIASLTDGERTAVEGFLDRLVEIYDHTMTDTR